MVQGEKEASASSKKETRSRVRRGPRKSRTSKVELVEQVIENIEKKLKSDQLKPSVGDFIRLLQLEKELEEERPREIKVSWVEPREEEHAGDR